ncbi:ComEC/Rec2 family competence protein [Arthrobacter halodurans]|uniref:ComEC/Rec2 family competence protein n=1 Tax=Arthrobacter halodurans TaxID=516699 RepID=A0ABV4UL10_9MICC
MSRSRPRAAEDAPTRVDARGLWLAGGGWAAAWLLVRQEAWVPAAAAALGSGALSLFALVLLRNRGLLAWASRWWAPLAAALAGATVVAGSIAGQSVGRHDPVLDAHVRSGESVRFTARLLEAPRPLRAAPAFAQEEEPAGAALGAESGGAASGTHPPARTAEPAASTWMAGARLERYAADGNWHASGGDRVLLVLSARHLPATGFPRAGDAVEGLARATAAPREDRERLWLRSSAGVRVLPAPGPPAPAEELRSRLVRHAAVLPADGPALLPGMVMGDRSGQDGELSDAMKSAGLVHLTAVSGANCAMILGAVLWIGRAAGLPRAAVFLASLACLLGFVALVRPEPSVVRAAVMGAVAAAAVYAGRGRQAFAALSACVVALLAWDPWFAGEPAFQLSVAATAGIVLLGRPLGLLLRRVLPGWLADGTAISVAAQLFCLPILVAMDAGLAVYSVPANVVVAPLIPVVTVAGTAALLLGGLPSPLVAPWVWVAGLPAALVGWVGRRVADLPHATLPWPEGPGGVAGAVLLAALALVASWLALSPTPAEPAGDGDGTRRFAAPRTLGAALAAAAAGLLLGITLPITSLQRSAPDEWLMAACDVGQGDALALRTGTDSAVLVDAGPDPDAVDSCLGALGVARVDALFITHLHADHAGGVAGVFGGRPVGPVYYSTAGDAPGPADLPPGVAAVRVGAGDRGSAGPVTWSVLSPHAGRPSVTENDASLVVLFGWDGSAEPRAASGSADPGTPGTTLLATGDIEEDAMRALLGRNPALRADILKVSHHGARNGGNEVIEQVGAGVALISVGRDNSYGHPAPAILSALESAGTPAFRTDTSGTLVLRSTPDGGLAVMGLGARLDP